jgi:hypothetical protein
MYSLNARTGNARTLAQIKPKFDNLKTKARKTVAARARILGKMDYFYFLRHMYETCL